MTASTPTGRSSRPSRRPLDDEAKGQIYRRYRMGVSVEVLAGQFGRTRSSIYRVINEMRAATNPRDQARVHAARELRRPQPRGRRSSAPMPEPADGKAPRRPKAPKGLPPYLASLYEVPLLGPRAGDAPVPQDELPQVPGQRARARPSTRPGPRPPDLDEIERLQEEALAVKNQIIRANLRLVVSIAKRHVGPSNNFFELVSDGNMSLIRAVEKFDYSRGNKFSTYASWAIMKNFARTIPEENYRRDRFVTGHEEMFEAAADNRTDEHEYESALEADAGGRQGHARPARRPRAADHHQPVRPGRRARAEPSSNSVANSGITKERVRQIESRGVDKLRKIASEEKLDLPML